MEPTASLTPQIVQSSHIGAVAATMAGAFVDDPCWGWVFNDPDPQRRYEQQVAFWSLALAGSIEHHFVWTTPGYEAATIWIVPGAPEYTEPSAAKVYPLLDELLGARSELAKEVCERFDAAHPHDEEHFYLSLFGTHPDHRGKGIGMRLLADNLTQIDAHHQPAYLESTNDANLRRYESVGFEFAGSFELPDDGPIVRQMWRVAR